MAEGRIKKARYEEVAITRKIQEVLKWFCFVLGLLPLQTFDVESLASLYAKFYVQNRINL